MASPSAWKKSRKNILIGIDFLKDVHLGRQVSVGNKVLVIGGGNVAFDCARVARRLGAEEVHVACLESRETMPANMEEIRDGAEEGIVVHPARAFNRVLIDNGCISGVECQEVDACEFGEDGDVQIKTVEDSKHTYQQTRSYLLPGSVRISKRDSSWKPD